MEQLGEPIEINKEFITLLETSIIPRYNKLLQELLDELKKELYNYHEGNYLK